MTEDQLHTRVGLGVLFALALAIVLVVGLEGRHLRAGRRIQVKLEHVGPIHEGMQVRVAGRQIGQVETVRLTGQDALLGVWLDLRHADLVRTTSEVFVNQQAVLGEAYLEVGPGRATDPLVAVGPPVPEGGAIRGVDPPRLDRLMQKSFENLQAVSVLLREGLPEAHAFGVALDELGRTVDALAPSPTSYANLARSVSDVVTEVHALDDALTQAQARPARIFATVDRAQVVIARARRELGTMSTQADLVIARVSAIADKLTPERRARFDQAVARFQSVHARLDEILAQTQALTAAVVRGEGTIGALLHDVEIADDFKATLKLMKRMPWTSVATHRDK